jgi:hypothetical protein
MDGISAARDAGIRYGRIEADAEAWQSCCIVGSGPSLIGFDFERFRQRTVLAVNDAALYVAWAAAIFTCDHRWLRSRIGTICRLPGEKFVAIPECHEDLQHYSCLTYLRRSHIQGLSEDPGRVAVGGCSGYGALNLAMLKGARLIELYGFDLTPGRAFQSEHTEDISRYQSWAREFRFTLPILRKRGISVLNMSRDSAIEVFPKV